VDTASLSLAGDVADLDELRRSLGLERMRLVGHGWGGVIAATFAIEHPDAVERLLLVSPWFPRLLHVWGVRTFAYESTDSVGLTGLDAARVGRLDVTDPVRFCRQYWGAWLSPADIRDPAVLRALRGPMCDAPPEALARVEAVNRAVMRTIGAWDIRERLDSVAAVTLLVQGLGTRPDSDSTAAFVWRTAAHEWTERLPRGGVVFLRAPAQFPWLGDRDAFDRVAGAFLGGGWPRDAMGPRTRIAAER
jgi:proline iminopeptidase